MKKLYALSYILPSLLLCQLFGAEQPLPSSEKISIAPVSYAATVHAIKNPNTPVYGNIFTPTPITLHELYELMRTAKECHKSLHNQLVTALQANNEACSLLTELKRLGIGVFFVPGAYLVTEILTNNVKTKKKHRIISIGTSLWK